MKKVVKSFYVHKSNVSELRSVMSDNDFLFLTDKISSANFDFSVIKFTKNVGITLIESNDWDTVNEPTVGTSHIFKFDGTEKSISGGNQVYHNKWEFVSPDYSGFSVEKAKERTKIWNSVDGIKNIKKYIGNKKYWHNFLNEHNLPI